MALPALPYEQNHFTIPVSGLADAACVLADELPEAQLWGVYSRNILIRSLSILAPDGWYYEGFGYWEYAMHYIVSGAAALQTTTGEDFFSKPPLCNSPLFLAHMYLPVPTFAFDFCDFGPRVERDGIHAQKGYYLPWHTLHVYLPFGTASLMQRMRPTPLLQSVIDAHALPSSIPSTTDFFNMFWQMPAPQEGTTMTSAACGPPYHYFTDMEVVHWRSNWEDPNATALAFKSGPPEGHNAAQMVARFPEWKMAAGHAHPDAGSFEIFSKGVFLANAGDAYVGKKDSANTDTILVDGTGQARTGTAWATFDDRPYQVYDQIHMANVWLGPTIAASTAVFATAYPDALQVTKMQRQLVMVDGRFLIVRDSIDSNLPHQYQWRLHGDRLATNPGPNRFVMENGPGRLVVQHLLPTDGFKLGPTIVDTEINAGNRPRLLQRGFHIEVSSPPGQRQFQFLAAMEIQSSKDAASDFLAKQTQSGSVRLSDRAGSCQIWTSGDAGLDGSYAYVLRDSVGKIISAGLCGRSLVSDDLSLQLTSPGQACIRPAAADSWQLDGSSSATNELRISGKSATDQTLKW